MEYDKVRKRVVSKTAPQCLLNENRKLIIANKALSNLELKQYAYCLKIPFFRGVFMRNDLPKKAWKNETAIVNLDDFIGSGTHWVCYKKLQSKVYYFDSFGNLPPPKELQNYFRNAKEILFNFQRFQKYNTSVCGHLCLEFLSTSVSML